MKKCLPCVSIVGVLLVIYLGFVLLSGYVTNKKMKTEAGRDPLVCALFVAQKMKSVGSKNELLTTIAVKYAEIGKPDHALQIAKKIRLTPTQSNMLAEIASACTKTGQKDKALEILSQALQVAKTIKDDFLKGHELELIAVKYVEAGQYDQALRIANTIERPCHRAGALVEIAFNYTKADQKDKASTILSQALQVAKREENDAIKNEQLVKIAVKYAEIGKYDQALEIVKMIGSPFLRVEALGGISANYAKAGQKEKTSEILSQAIRLAEKIKGTERLAGVAEKYVEIGEYEQAIQLSKTIGYTSEANVLTKIASEYAKAGQKEKASEILSQALQIAETPKEDYSKFLVLVNISSEYAKAGQKEKASEILSQALHVNRAKEDFLLRVIAVKYTEIHQYDQALQVAKTIKSSPLKDITLAEIALKYAETEQKMTEIERRILQEIIKELE